MHHVAQHGTVEELACAVHVVLHELECKASGSLLAGGMYILLVLCC